MSRVFFRPGSLTAHPNHQGNDYFLIDGQKVHFYTEAGTPYIVCDLEAPIHPELRKHVIKVTYQTRIDDHDHMKLIAQGEYIHGHFRADVRRSIQSNDKSGSHWVMWVNASAPTVSMLRRFLRPLLAGNDTPTHAYTR
ncbi:MAG: hypothetical protein UY72_C0027G0001, partial [Candidatus Uhrbacteria bacterium GW2011_GWD2_52_7]